MLRVTVELVPYGVEEDARVIGTMLIANDGSGNYQYADYAFAYQNDNNPSVIAKGTVKHHARSLGFWPLIKRVLSATSDNSNNVTDILVERLKES